MSKKIISKILDSDFDSDTDYESSSDDISSEEIPKPKDIIKTTSKLEPKKEIPNLFKPNPNMIDKLIIEDQPKRGRPKRAQPLTLEEKREKQRQYQLKHYKNKLEGTVKTQKDKEELKAEKKKKYLKEYYKENKEKLKAKNKENYYAKKNI